MSKPSGGAAFPSGAVTDHNGDIVTYAEPGMTLRDYFAAKAMGLVSGSLSPADFSAQCYRIADAMLAERAK